MGTVLFSGISTLNQVERIVELVGKPPSDEMSGNAMVILNAISVDKKKSFSTLFPMCSVDGLDLLKKMLTFTPKNRISLNEILKHEYLSQFANKSSNLEGNGMLIKYPEDEHKLLTLKEYSEMVLNRLQKKKSK